MKRVIIASSRSRDDAIKEFISIEVLRGLDQGRLDAIREIIFHASSVNWESALESVLENMPELKLKLKMYNLN